MVVVVVVVVVVMVRADDWSAETRAAFGDEEAGLVVAGSQRLSAPQTTLAAPCWTCPALHCVRGGGDGVGGIGGVVWVVATEVTKGGTSKEEDMPVEQLSQNNIKHISPLTTTKPH